MDRADKMKIIQELEEKETKYALAKMDTWKKEGSTLFDTDFLRQRWNSWVEAMATDKFQRGMLVDETIEVLRMIKSEESLDLVANYIEKISGGMTIIDSYLAQFIGAEIPYEIRQIIEERQKGMGLK